MTTASTGWKAAFSAFLDRRALIMLFLGFSAGIPILLIFSSLSLWLGEAGIEKSAITFFSWAALGYSFKFVWAPLIDELPVPLLTQHLGRRRAWLLIAQLLIIGAIFIMAYSDPSLGSSYLYQMAFGAVLLGFSAATQDIVIDAYRIELADTAMQTILASTYNAGYRIGMIVAGAGALFLAAYLGTSKGNYIYEAWKSTYLVMAMVMLVGVITTLMIREPQVERIRKSYRKIDYYRLVLVFIISVSGFITSYIYAGQLIRYFHITAEVSDGLALFALEALRFISSGVIALFIGMLLVKMGVVNKQMAYETWVSPIADFFRRYGIRLALVLLLLIGFYRISDIISGVISNVFYQDLNFTKEQIAEAVKVYGVIFSLLGGFLGGLLAQRINIMKLMFIGAVLASMTNLTFIGLVKSGMPLGDVTVQAGKHHYVAHPDEVGLWSVQVPSQVLAQSDHIQVDVQYQNQPSSLRSFTLPYLLASGQPQILLLPISADDQLSSQELKQGVVIRGQLAGIDTQQLHSEKPVILHLDGQEFIAKLDSNQMFSAVIDAKALRASPSKKIMATVTLPHQNHVLQTYRTYQLSQAKPELNVDLHEIAPVVRHGPTIEIQGKVIKSYSSTWLYFAIVVDNLAAGLAGAAFIAFLSSLTSVSFTAVQYAIFSSLMTLTPKILGGYSGTIVTKIGYPDFFLMTTLMGIPILLLVVWVAKLLKEHQRI